MGVPLRREKGEMIGLSPGAGGLSKMDRYLPFGHAEPGGVTEEQRSDLIRVPWIRHTILQINRETVGDSRVGDQFRRIVKQVGPVNAVHGDVDAPSNVIARDGDFIRIPDVDEVGQRI